ncbi:MAG TPA: hypothetical protein VD926_11495 [Acidimicrobiales bacterium]|nr:hypothetical protein [Acidimicrobiales bacterium]
MIQLDQLPQLTAIWRSRYTARDERIALIDAVVRGEYDQVDPLEDPVESRSPNLIQVALEDTAEAASVMPTVRVAPSRKLQSAKDQAARMERVAAGYFEAAQMDLLLPRTFLDLAGRGIASWVVWPDREQQLPLIEWRDPTYCYPEPGMRPGDRVRRCIFARTLYVTQLPPDWQAKLRNGIDDPKLSSHDSTVTLVEYFDDDHTIIAGLWGSGRPSITGGGGQPGYDWKPVLFDEWENRSGVCPVIVGARISLDGEVRGQFDQVIGTLLAHVRLMGMVLDYADQAVYSEMWVRDLIGELPYGGNGYIELGPQGAIGRVPPAVSSLNVTQDLQMLTEALHLGGRWPKSRPGDVDQSIASAKFVEATAGMMNTAIRTYHGIARHMMEQALRVCFAVDKAQFPGQKSISGVLRNQEFVEDYDTEKDINLKHKVRVEYGLGLGRDPAQSAVLMLQYAGQKYISREFVQENIDGLTDVAREQERIDVEQLRELMLGKLLQGVQEGTIPDRALVEIMRARSKGEDLAELFEKHVVSPAEQFQADAIPTADGLVAPGTPLGAGAEGGPLPPPPPEAAGLLARLGVPAGPGGLLGTQQQTSAA